MDITRYCLGALLVGFTTLVGCGISDEQIQRAIDTQERLINSWVAAGERITAPPSGNRSSEEGVAYQVRMAIWQAKRPEPPDILGTVLNYDIQSRRVTQDWVLGIWNGRTLGLILCEIPLDCSQGGSGDVKLVAKGGSNINADIVRDGLFVNGDDNMTARGSAQAQDDGVAAARDGQNTIDSQGVSQAQVQSDSFPGTTFNEGGEFQPNSAFDAGVSLP